MAIIQGAAISGVGRLRANLDFLQFFMSDGAKEIMREEKLAAANDIAETAIRLAPRRTGDLQDGIHVEQNGESVEVISSSEHSKYVEFGTVKMAAEPFLRPAFYQYGYFKKMGDRLKEKLKEGLV